MVREELYVTVPSFFRCPISLDVMKSPVSLTTGVTYDRSSIQTWLDSGNNTCPATMQILQSKEIVPNLTLQRLIQIWSNSASKRVDPDSDSVSVSVHSALACTPTFDQARFLIKEIEDDRENCRVDSLSKLVCFAGESDRNRKVLAKIDGFVSRLVDLISNANGGDLLEKKISFIEQIVKILHVMVINDCLNKIDLAKMMLKNDSDCLSLIVIVLQKGSSDSQTAALQVLESIAIDAESKLLIAGKSNLLQEILTFLMSEETNSSTIESSLSCLLAIAIPKRIRIKTVEFGIVRSLSKLLTNPNSTVAISEQVLKLLEMVTSCTEGRSAICEDSSCVAAITRKVMKVSNTATEDSVMILWSICYLFRDQNAQEAVAKNNGLAKILLLMQSNCSPRVKQMSADLLKIFRVNSKSCLSGYDTNTTHIMPF